MSGLHATHIVMGVDDWLPLLNVLKIVLGLLLFVAGLCAIVVGTVRVFRRGAKDGMWFFGGSKDFAAMCLIVFGVLTLGEYFWRGDTTKAIIYFCAGVLAALSHVSIYGAGRIWGIWRLSRQRKLG